MPYDVVKLINGHQYRYEVTSFRDPITRKVRQTWSYVGRLDAQSHRDAPAPADGVRCIVAAILKLLDKRDVSHVSVSTIARAAGISRSTFYRCFPNKSAALKTAFETALGEPRRTSEYALLDGPIGTIELEKQRLASWIEAILRTSVRSAGVQRAMSSSRELHALRQRRSRENHAEVHAHLLDYLRRLRAAGIIASTDLDALAEAIQCVISGIFKRTVYDQEYATEPARLKAGIHLVHQALFRHQETKSDVKSS